MYTLQGNITIGAIDRIYSQSKFREMVGAATNIVIPKVAGAAWEKRIQAILRLAEDVDVGDASHPVQETRTWIMDYLIERYVRDEEEREKAALVRYPYMKDGLIRIFLEDFSKWLDVNFGKKLDSHELARKMRRIGGEPDHINLTIGGARTSRNCWKLPDSFHPPQRDQEENESRGDAPE